MNRTLTLFFLVVVLLIFRACEKTEGYGGAGSIEGYLVTRYYNDDMSVLVREEPAVDMEVFLLFGDASFVGDNIETSYDGAFGFQYLRQGNYTLYYSSDDTGKVSNDNQVVRHEIELKNGEELDLDTLYRSELLDFDDGFASIYGVVRVVNFRNESEFPFLEVKDTSYAQEQEVYLVYGEHNFIDERVRTDYKGFFEFGNLIPGDYEIFVYSEDRTGGTEDIPEIRNVTITGESEEVNLGTIMIDQL